ncbi:phage tail tape measure protein [Streptomyces sp. NPDC057413]|uniref:phage tail tape measure protein n=1 Tax=Streptomyces sp. NPDC057413 TaxID=3346124 RepID=UPI0036BFCE8E
MATRTVNVRLIADVNQYTRSMRQAARQTSQLANAGAVIGTAMVAGFAVAAASAAKFDKALSNVRAVSGANRKEMEALRAAALEAGRTTSFTATQAADAEAELARAGVKVADITGGALKGSLALAASGQMDLADAAVIAAQAMNTFGLHGQDVSHIADVLSAAANKSAADMHGLGMSLRMGGLLANQTGLSLEETVGTLAAFADHALIGSDAGTSLKVMLQRLVPQSKEAAGMMDKLGFSAYDNQGKFVGLSELAGRMQKSFSKLTPEARNAAMATIFGADAVRSATILYELGSKGIDEYVKSVDDQGAASRMASVQTDNLVGDFERLRGALEVALIESGSAANGTLRQMVQWVTQLVNVYSSLPPGVQHAVTLFTGFGGALALAAAGVLLLIPRIHATTTALAAMGVTAARVRTVMMGIGRLGVVVAGLEAITWGTEKLNSLFQDAPPNVTKMGNALLYFARNGKAAGELTKTFGKDLDGFGEAVARIAHPGVLDRVGDSLYTITHLGNDSQGLDEARDKIKAVDEALKSLVEGGASDVAAQAFQKLAREAEAQGTSTEKLRTLLPQYAEALTATDTQQQLTAESQKKLAQEAGLTTEELQDQRSEAEKLSDALKMLNGGAISAAEKEISFRQSLSDLTQAVKDNGHSLDVTTEKGRAVKGAFLDAAKAAMEHAQAVAEQSQSQSAGQSVLEKDIGLLRKRMEALHFSKDAIDQLLGAYLRLPGTVTTKVDAKTAAAMADLQAVQAKLRGTKGKTVTVSALTAEARKALEDLGFKIKSTKGKSVTITVPTGGPKAAVDAIQRYLNSLQSKTITITTVRKEHVEASTISRPYKGEGNLSKNAHGGLIRRYADGGSVQYIPFGGPVVGPGTGTSDSIPALISNGEYVIKASSVRKYGVHLFDRLNAGRYASGGPVRRYASGGFTYSPTGGIRSISDVQSAYSDAHQPIDKAAFDKAIRARANAVDALRAAEARLAQVRRQHHTRAQLIAAENAVAKARRTLATATDAAKSAEARYRKQFSLTDWQKTLSSTVAANASYEASLSRIAARGGSDVIAQLRDMGAEGAAMVSALARASNKQFAAIVANLRRLGPTAKASLKDFTAQMNASTKVSQQFANDLQTLAARGFGDLAQALAAQGDDIAQVLARQAVTGSAKDLAAANKAVAGSQGALSGEDLTNALILLSTLRGGQHRGFAELIAAGLDVATIRALVPRMAAQIKALPAANKDTFMRQWVQQGGKAMALGGILDRPTMVLGGEAGVRESWIPWNSSARSRSLLSTTAAAMGYQLVPAGRYGSSGASAAALVREVSKQININLYGAKQSTAEQLHDIARHMAFVG